jgi:rhomboid protease GluP
MELRLNKTFLSRKPSPESTIIAAISLAMLLLFFGFNERTFSANGYLVFEKHEYWRAFTTTLLHADLNHLAHNAFFFTGLAALLHNYFGLWVFPVLSLFVGGIINLICLYFYPPQVFLVGVSGVIYFMASFWLVLYLLIERRQTVKVRFLHAFAVSLIFLFPEAFQPETSYLAHGMGFVIGLPVGLLYYFWNRKQIRAKDEWIEIKKHKDPIENVILLENGDFVLLNEDD